MYIINSIFIKQQHWLFKASVGPWVKDGDLRHLFHVASSALNVEVWDISKKNVCVDVC